MRKEPHPKKITEWFTNKQYKDLVTIKNGAKLTWRAFIMKLAEEEIKNVIQRHHEEEFSVGIL